MSVIEYRSLISLQCQLSLAVGVSSTDAGFIGIDGKGDVRVFMYPCIGVDSLLTEIPGDYRKIKRVVMGSNDSAEDGYACIVFDGPLVEVRCELSAGEYLILYDTLNPQNKPLVAYDPDNDPLDYESTDRVYWTDDPGLLSGWDYIAADQ